MELDNILVSENLTVLEAMKALDTMAKRLLLVTENERLKAVLTDGDIRRHILSGGALDQPITLVANYDPIVIYEENRTEARQIMREKKIHALPVVDEQRRVLSVVFWDDLETERTRQLKLPVVIMAGGLGARLYPYTKILPKPLIPIGDLPIVEHIINRFQHFGCQDYRLIVNYKKNMIKSYFSETEHAYQVSFIDEDAPLGTGGGLSLLKGSIHEPFFLSNCDVLIEANYESIYRQHQEQQNLITMVCAFKHVRIPYGVVKLDGNGRIHTMTEKPQFSFLTNTGMYLVEPRVVDEMPEGEAIAFPDIIERYRAAGENIGVYPVDEKCWLDMGQLEELEDMRNALGV